jgi:hypothetical protein
MNKKLTAEQLQHINNCILQHNVDYLSYRGNDLGWHHYIEFPEDLFPDFNEKFLSENWEEIISYSDDEIKSLKCEYIDYECRRVWVNLLGPNGKRVVPICPTSVIDDIYRDAEKLAYQCINLLCKTAYDNSLYEAKKNCENQSIFCSKDELTRLVPYNNWVGTFVKVLIGAWLKYESSNRPNRDDWYTEPALSHHVITPVICSAADDDLPF